MFCPEYELFLLLIGFHMFSKKDNSCCIILLLKLNQTKQMINIWFDYQKHNLSKMDKHLKSIFSVNPISNSADSNQFPQNRYIKPTTFTLK